MRLLSFCNARCLLFRRDCISLHALYCELRCLGTQVTRTFTAALISHSKRTCMHMHTHSTLLLIHVYTPDKPPLLFRFYDIEPGHGGVYIDGQDIRSVTQASLRRAIGMVPQVSYKLGRLSEAVSMVFLVVVHVHYSTLPRVDLCIPVCSPQYLVAVRVHRKSVRPCLHFRICIRFNTLCSK